MATSNQTWVQSLHNWLQLNSAHEDQESLLAAVAAAEMKDLESILEVLLANCDALSASPQRLRILLQALATRFMALLGHRSAVDSALVDPETLAGLYERLLEVDSVAAAHALQMLSAQGDEESLDSLAGVLAALPPEDWQVAALAISPLWNAGTAALELFFDRLDDGLPHPATLTILLDLSNHSVRSGKLDRHPWEARHAAFSQLLSSVCQRLTGLEHDPSRFGSDVASVQRVLGESVSLTVALCDTLGWIGTNQDAALDALTQALGLSHRRIQAEAAGALARLGSELGQNRLVELAADPVARLRAVSYAEEMGISELIDEPLRLPHALAESQLAAWLAGPEQFGFPPHELELIDLRTMYWPGYDEPRDCYLFRYTYHLPSGQISNIGIVGPVTHAFHADLANLPVDDIYAAFAGWQGEHEDIFEVPAQLLNSAQRREADLLLARLRDQDLAVSETLALTFFLGEVALLAVVMQGEKKRCAITDGQELLCFPISNSATSLTPDVVLAIYRGRKILRTFNV